jgi:hypothetical protein
MVFPTASRATTTVRKHGRWIAPLPSHKLPAGAAVTPPAGEGVQRRDFPHMAPAQVTPPAQTTARGATQPPTLPVNQSPGEGGERSNGARRLGRAWSSPSSRASLPGGGDR